MTRRPKKSAAFSAAGRILSRPAMRPLTRTFSNLHPNYPTMLLTVTGRKSGRSHTVPLIYIDDGERLVIAAAYAGSDSNPAWWLNLRTNPQAVAQVNNDTFAVEAALASADERPQLWRRLVGMYPYFTDYQQRTTREIPVIILTRIGAPRRKDNPGIVYRSVLTAALLTMPRASSWLR